MSTSNITMVFGGEAVNDGEIDVADLAPALLALSALIQTSNKEINGEHASMAVKVKAVSEGSFEIHLALTQSLIDYTKLLFDFSTEHKDGIANASALVDLLFKVGGAAIGGVGVAAGGLFALLKILKGKKPQKIEEKQDSVHITIEDKIFVTDKRVIKLAESLAVRELATKVVSALEKEGIDTFAIKRKGHPELSVLKEEVSFFKAKQDDEKIKDSIVEMVLQIIRLSFLEDNKWLVTNGRDKFSVTITDSEFLNKIATNEVAFSKGDYLVCTVQETQYLTAKGLRQENVILKVLEHRPAVSGQLRLL